jgi:transcriptional regulator with XRE-family HTH domain
MTKRKTAKDLHSVWMKDPEYAKAYADLEPEYQIASAVIEARSIAGLTQADLAVRMETTQTAIARLESGATMPSTRTLKRVAEATGLRMLVGFSSPSETIKQFSSVAASMGSGRSQLPMVEMSGQRVADIAARMLRDPSKVSKQDIKLIAASVLSRKSSKIESPHRPAKRK